MAKGMQIPPQNLHYFINSHLIKISFNLPQSIQSFHSYPASVNYIQLLVRCEEGAQSTCKNKIKFQSAIKIILFMPDGQSHPISMQIATPLRKFSDQPLTDHSEHESPIPNKPTLTFPEYSDLRQHLYDQLVPHYPLSDRMNRRGINWLLTLCWSRGFQQPCIWTAMLLYYAYKNHFPFGKEEMEGIMLTCLQLSSKFHQSAPLQTRDLLLLMSRPIPRQDLRTYEERLLLITDFNLVIPHYLSYLCQLLPSEQAEKVYFMCELLLLKNHHIFFDKEKIERITMLAQGCFEGVPEEEISEIKEMMADKESKILYHKYSNKFDTDALANTFGIGL